MQTQMRQKKKLIIGMPDDDEVSPRSFIPISVDKEKNDAEAGPSSSMDKSPVVNETEEEELC